jgi:hypothetical protein
MAVLTKQDIEELAQAALDEYGLTAAGWTFRWDRARRRAGQCRYGPREIGLSWPVFELESNRDRALDTILHEVAHVLAGPGAGHGHRWKVAAITVGADPRSCDSQLQAAPGPWVADCSCEHEHTRYKAPPAGATYRCNKTGQPVVWRRR